MRVARSFAYVMSTAVLATACNLERNIGADPTDRVTQLFVTPDSVMLDPLGGYQFRAYGRNTAGDTVSVNVAWTASAGTITSAGYYTADSSENDAAVTATRSSTAEGDATLSGTSLVKKRRVIEVVLTPGSAALPTGAALQFDAEGVRNTGDTVSVQVTYAATGGTITSGGRFTAGMVPGNYRVIATRNGNASMADTAPIAVLAIPVAGVTVTPATAGVRVGGTVQLAATPRDSAGNALTGRAIAWTTSAAGVASVSGNGLVTGVAVGSATITATSEGTSGTAIVTVSTVPVASVTVTPASATLVPGATVQLSVTTKDSAGNVLTGRSITWTTSAAGVATVSASGQVGAVAPGTATITATSEGKSATAAITVSAIPVATVTVTPAATALLVTQTAQLTAAAKDSAGAVLTGRTVTWASGNTAVATVNASGLVTAKTAGSATITATSEGKSGTAAVTVTLAPVATVTVSPAAPSIQAGATVQLAATVKDSAGNTLSGRTVTWASGNPAVATVTTAGLVAGVTAGSAAITATSEGKAGTATVTVTAPPPPGTRAGYYVAPNGTSGGDGSVTQPWDLRTALAGAGGRIRPGDTVWVRAGTYRGSFTTTLTGTSTALIVVRAYPGERAIIDGNGSTNSTFVVDGAWAAYWGLEIMNSMTVRSGDGLGVRPTGVYVRNADNVKLINLIVHDTGHGTYTEYTTQNIEIYGWIIFNGGHQNSTRSDGHGIYIKHDGAGSKVVRDNVIFNQFAFGVHGYTESSGALRNMVFEGNVLFNNGELSNDDNPNLQIGGNRVADNNVVADNALYFSPGHGWWNLRMGYSTLMNGATVVRNNYVVGGGEMVEVGYWQNLDWIGNTLVGPGNMVRMNDPSSAGQAWDGNMHVRDPNASAWRFGGSWRTFDSWRQASGLGATDQATSGTPTANKVIVRPNRYEPGRATVVIYNWTRQGSVSVDLSGVVPAGYVYEIRNVQQVFGSPVATGTFGGGAVSFPMGGVTAQAPIGGSPNAPLVTGPDFNVFVVTSRAP